MDSFEANKIFGAVLGTIFVVFGGSLLADGIFHSEAPETPGFAIAAAEAPAAGGGAPAAAEDPPVAALLVSASAEKGAAEFKKCQACHAGEEGGQNKVGPHLWDIVNRPIASVGDFGYSAALREFSQAGTVPWDYDHLYQFLKAPKTYVPGTAMGFAGIKDPAARADVIAYLRSLSKAPAALPEAPAPSAEAAPAAEGVAAPAAGEGDAAPAATAPADAPVAPASGAEAPTTGSGPTPPAQQPEAPAAPADAPAPAAPEPAAPAAPAPAPVAPAPAPAAQQGAVAPAAPAATEVAGAGDAKAGAQVFKKCQACHAVGPGAKNKIGPELNGIVGEATAAVEGYSFSTALVEHAKANPVWDAAHLTAWLADPKGLVPGTKMAFPGLKKPEDLANVIAYLASFDETGAGGPAK